MRFSNLSFQLLMRNGFEQGSYELGLNSKPDIHPSETILMYVVADVVSLKLRVLSGLVLKFAYSECISLTG